MDPYLGEIRVFSFGNIPYGWAQCNGQLLSITENELLFQVLGATYGGDGVTTFALPDLQGRMPMHIGPGLSQGAHDGEETHQLTVAELPSHTHSPQGSMNFAATGNPVNAIWANQASAPYSTRTPNVAMHPSAIGETGDNQPHENMSPFLVFNFCIALEGIMPTPGS